MRKFSVKTFNGLSIYYNHYLSAKLLKDLKESLLDYYFKEWYPLRYSSRRFDKPAAKLRDGTCFWKLDDESHRVGKPAVIHPNGIVRYWENGKEVL